jgi:hypothetical protein
MLEGRKRIQEKDERKTREELSGKAFERRLRELPILAIAAMKKSLECGMSATKEFKPGSFVRSGMRTIQQANKDLVTNNPCI